MPDYIEVTYALLIATEINDSVACAAAASSSNLLSCFLRTGPVWTNTSAWCIILFYN